ncbi:MAG: MGDG synthase family glycosyltransferase [Christensenellales bacterium]
MKRILLITSNYTGHGHRSISDAISEQLTRIGGISVMTVDGFSLIGTAGVSASKLYGPITRRYSKLWEKSFAVTNNYATGMADMMTPFIQQRFIKKCREFNPDSIVTVHSMFLGAILNLLKLYRIDDIPFIVCQADLIDIHASWCDPRATTTICLTEEAVAASIRHGMPPSSLEKIGFPIRARFCDHARQYPHAPYDGGKLKLLMMSGGDGGTDMMLYAKEILTNTDCKMEFICGRDKKSRQRLEAEILPRFPDRVRVFGFVDDVEKHMERADLLIARGSPNTLMEAVVMNLPIMIIGALPGQEADNPALLAAHNLAITCDSPKAAPYLLKALTQDGGKRLHEISAAQRAYRDLDAAKRIAERIDALTVPLNRPFPNRKRTAEIAERIRNSL